MSQRVPLLGGSVQPLPPSSLSPYESYTGPEAANSITQIHKYTFQIPQRSLHNQEILIKIPDKINYFSDPED